MCNAGYFSLWSSALKVFIGIPHEVTPAPNEYITQGGTTPSITVDADTITLGTAPPTTIDRATGERLFVNLDYFRGTQNGTWVRMDMSIQNNQVVQQQSMDLQSGVKGRN